MSEAGQDAHILGTLKALDVREKAITWEKLRKAAKVPDGQTRAYVLSLVRLEGAGKIRRRREPQAYEMWRPVPSRWG